MLTKKVLLCVLVTLEVTVCQKTSDESRPYEFGFTIDGQQHRHEKKDQNGIIQGEFGFITADGVYHVTVYATDENGDFKILSMRNIRISAPLDGSPALGPISPEASKYLKKANLPNQIEPAKSKPLPVTPQKFERIQEAPPKSSTQKPIVSTQKAPYVFTTHSTIRPACAGCGLITTRKPGEKFVFQNPAFRDSPPSSTKTVIQSPLGPPALQSGAITDLQNRFGDLPSDTELLPPNFNGKIVQSTAGKPPVTFAKVQNFESPKQKFNPGFKSPVDGNEIQLNKANQGSGVPSPSNVPFVSQGPVKPLNDVPVLDSFGPPGGAVPPNGVQAPNAVQTLSRDQAPTGVQAPNGVQAPSGVQTLSGVQTPSGVQIPSGVQVPSSAQTSGGIETFGYDRTSEQVDQNLNGVVDSVNAADQDEKVELVSGQVNQGNLQQDKLGRLVAPSIGTNGPNPLLQPQDVSKLPPVMISDNVIHVMGKKPLDIAIKDKYPGMVDGLPEGVEVKDVTGILYKFKYTVGFHGHYEKGLKNGTKIGGYFVNGRDGISRIVTYVADENGYRPKFKFVNLGLDSSDTPNEKTEKTFGLKDFEFVWYPVE